MICCSSPASESSLARQDERKGKGVSNHSGANHSAKVSQLRCFESFPLCCSQRKPPTLMVSVPSLRRFFFHFSHTSNFTPGFPTATCSFIVADTHFVGRPCWRPFMTSRNCAEKLTINRIHLIEQHANVARIWRHGR